MTAAPNWLAALGALALAGGFTGVALARPTPTPTREHLGLGQYSVTISVPMTVPEGTEAKIIAKGRAAIQVHLEVFVSTYKPAGIAEKCFRDAALEKANDAHSIINRLVKNGFSSEAAARATAKGTWYACAYLYTTPDHSLARAEGEWREVKK